MRNAPQYLFDDFSQTLPSLWSCLTICKKIVDRLGGTIWVKSQLGSGSTFLFALPDRVLK
ncbi:MAG: ATP-binding protein [Candidatus Acidiferrum sp.]